MTAKAASWGICFLFLIIAAGCKKDDNPTDNSQGITVNGFVKDRAGAPINGVAVVIKGKSAVTSGADGSFSVAGVATPYDVTMILSTQKAAIVYRGLTRTDPTLVYANASLGTVRTATITGTIPAAATKKTLVTFVSGTTEFYTTTNTGTYTINASWSTSSISYTGKVYVLRWTPVTSGFPTTYDAFGSKDLTISSSGSFSVNFSSGELTDPAEQVISGSVTRSVSTYVLNARNLFINFGSLDFFVEAESGVLADNFNITVPNITGATFGIFASSSRTTPSGSAATYKSGIAAGTAGVALSIASAPQLSAPVNNGTNVDTATFFLYDPGTGTGIHQIQFSPAVVTNPTFTIYTSATSETIPNLTSFGLDLPAASVYSWRVIKISSLSSVNDAASGTLVSILQGLGANVGYGQSEAFRFTTRP